MKKCKYCGSVVRENVTTCPSCGASEFSNICASCGTVFDSGYCPNCGTRARAQAKICPVCGEQYFSNACPNCGYTGNGQGSDRRSNSDSRNYSSPFDRFGSFFGFNRGYSGDYNQNSRNSWYASGRNQTVYRREDTMKIILSILGWIFCFPLMLFITVIKAKSLAVILRIIFIIAILSMLPVWMRILLLFCL